jgi:anti-sigma-K factor RskA
MTGREHIPQEDLALYAMQTLSSEESAAVRLHLADCAFCRAELAEISGDLALVAMSVEQHPLPEGARQRFIDRAYTASVNLPPSRQPAVAPIAGSPARRPTRWAPWAAVAALAILAISLGAKINSLNEELRNESDFVARLAVTASRAQEVLNVLTEPSAQRVMLTPGKTPAVPTGRAVYLADRGGLIFQASNLAHLPEGRTYELWVIPASGEAPVPAGLFQPDATGNANLVLPPLPKGIAAKAFGVTIEKAEGSKTPTVPIILSGLASTAGG